MTLAVSKVKLYVVLSGEKSMFEPATDNELNVLTFDVNEKFIVFDARGILWYESFPMATLSNVIELVPVALALAFTLNVAIVKDVWDVTSFFIKSRSSTVNLEANDNHTELSYDELVIDKLFPTLIFPVISVALKFKLFTDIVQDVSSFLFNFVLPHEIFTSLVAFTFDGISNKADIINI